MSDSSNAADDQAAEVTTDPQAEAPAENQAPAVPADVQAFSVSDLFPDRQAVRRAIDLLLPMARKAAEQTETLVDDAAVDVWQALHDSDLAVEWAAQEIGKADMIPEGALAISVMPDDVKQEVLDRMPGERREEFLDGKLLEKAMQWGLPILLQVLQRVLLKR